MGAVGYSVRVSGDGHVDAFRESTWNLVQNFVHNYTAGPPYADLHSYLDHADPADSPQDAGATTADWWFPDLTGVCHRSANAWLHWFGLAVAVRWPYVRGAARERGVTITQEGPERGEAAPTGDRFVVLRGVLWQIDADGLYADDKWLSIEELSADERAAYEGARELCACGVCDFLRPDEDAFAAALAELRDGDAEGIRRSAAVLGWMNRTTAEVLESLVQAAVRVDGSAFYHYLSDPVEYCALMLPGAWEQLLAMARTVDDHRCITLILEALAALYYREGERTAAEKAAFLAEVRIAADPGGRWNHEWAQMLLAELEREDG
ncbi:hypothetical protein KZZ52_27005 [Dactylosporangium sp. AC04546]|uniref:hypothetical protein n=1 Tax=Dactylosporangium sp. AC04546 TaxID=2862460 RepID=UPI001EE12E57|nr:hypothetical protein [Dactylosporangium sp. AC04546]WVK88916.1 hypothetical protein KZZ52_27005 [Dactylosporangium sp. AC04546]